MDEMLWFGGALVVIPRRMDRRILGIRVERKFSCCRTLLVLLAKSRDLNDSVGNQLLAPIPVAPEMGFNLKDRFVVLAPACPRP